MPHTWISSEYARAIFGMLMREDDDRLQLLPGAPPSWAGGEGLRVGKLPTAYGTLSMTARQRDATLHVTLEPGLRDGTPAQLWWPTRRRPAGRRRRRSAFRFFRRRHPPGTAFPSAHRALVTSRASL